MNKNKCKSYSLGFIFLLMIATTTPVFAEISSIQTNSESFYKGEQIKFSGIAEKDSMGLVTIVIRDLNDEFVLLTQAVINPDDTFEKTIKIEDRFLEHGIYYATGFILNVTKGVTTDFTVSLNGAPIILNEKEIKNENIKENPLDDTEKEIKTKDIITATSIADFVNSSKSPQYYIERYYNEILYKSWFDRNYPDLTIEDAVGYTGNIIEIKSTVQEIIDKEIIPEAQASSLVETAQEQNNNPEIAQISLAVAGLVVLFGAVYGIKRNVDNNSKLISINRKAIRKRLFQSIIGTNPKNILQMRLAKGEITLDEYEKIKSKLY